MALTTATIVGGNTVTFDLSGAEKALALNALEAIQSGFTSSSVLTDPSESPSSVPGRLNVYNLDSLGVDSVVAAANTHAVIMLGPNPGGVNIQGNNGAELIIGSSKGDTINPGRGDGTVIGGGGNDSVVLRNTGTVYVGVGTGNDTVDVANSNAHIVGAGPGDRLNVAGGNTTVSADGPLNAKVYGGESYLTLNGGTLSVVGGNNHVTVAGGQEFVSVGGSATLDVVFQAQGQHTVTGLPATIHQQSSGDYKLVLDGQDTIYLGAGNDTITQEGASTVYGGSGNLNYTSGSGRDSVIAGSGNATLLGGGGADTLIGGSGRSTLSGGSGSDLLVGGSFRDTLIGGGGNDLFRFTTSAAGGAHTITDFVKGHDKIDLTGGGYSLADIANKTVSGSDTTVTFNDGTKIILKNFKNLTSSDFV